MKCSNYTEGCQYDGDVLYQCSCDADCDCTVCSDCIIKDGKRLTCKPCQKIKKSAYGWE